MELSDLDITKLRSFTRNYLNNLPSFFAYIRPQEALLFWQHQQEMNGPILDFGCGDGFFADMVFDAIEIDEGLDLVESRIKNQTGFQFIKT